MKGLDLPSMDAADMFDVIHAAYEEDITPTWEQGPEVKDAVRTKVYELLYGRDYKFSVTGQGASHKYGLAPGEDLDSIPDLPEIPVESRQTRPYVPPSTPQELANVLEPPVN